MKYILNGGNDMKKQGLTVLIPCLNEAKTIEICIKKAFASIKKLGIDGEVLIADNGSTDGSGRYGQTQAKSF